MMNQSTERLRRACAVRALTDQASIAPDKAQAIAQFIERDLNIIFRPEALDMMSSEAYAMIVLSIFFLTPAPGSVAEFARLKALVGSISIGFVNPGEEEPLPANVVSLLNR